MNKPLQLQLLGHRVKNGGLVAVHLHFESVVVSFCALDLDFGDSMRVLRTEMFFNGVPGEFEPTLCLFPVGDEAENVGVLTSDTLLGVSVSGQHIIL